MKVVTLRRVLAGLLGILVLFGVAYLGLSLTARPIDEHPFFHDDDGVLVMAHQGGDGLWPSNTIYAFRQAVQAGADVLELDVHTSRDGSLVVIHDDTVDRTTDGSGRVEAKTLAELKRLDAGFGWSPERMGESFPYRGRGLTIPTLAEVFETFPNTRLNVEIKDAEPELPTLCATSSRSSAGKARLWSSPSTTPKQRPFASIAPMSPRPPRLRKFAPFSSSPRFS